jgi:rhodanese-related sulfurtransferase
MAPAPEPREAGPDDGIDRASVLDCRSAEEFARGHLAGSGNLPLAEIEERRHELPPRDVPVVVVADRVEQAARAAEVLAGLGYPRVRHLEVSLADVEGGHADLAPAITLWRPSGYLASRIAGIPRGLALDLASGAGRDAVFLALAGFEVEAWDHAPEALARAEALAQRHGVRITTRVVDLEKKRVDIPAARFDLVTVLRFLHRPLLPTIERAIAPGGHLVYETFRRGQERFGRPTHPRFLFWPGELESAFPSLEVLHYEETDPPGGPLLARLHARRKA